MICLCYNWSVSVYEAGLNWVLKLIKMCVRIVCLFFVVVFLVQEYQNCKEVSKWAQINMETLIRVFESVRLMHFIQFCNIITEILLFHSKYLKHFSIFKMTCFNKETMTSLSNTTSKLCLITPGVCVCGGGGGGVQRILL